MAMPNYSYPPDPMANEPGWKDITNRAGPIVKKFLAKATELFGPPTNSMPVRVTELKSAPQSTFHNGIAYIRVGQGVSANPDDEHDLKGQIAHEIVHVLFWEKDVKVTMLEEGLCSYFAINYGGEHVPRPEDREQRRYYEAYELVTKLLEKCPVIIRQLRVPPCSIDKIAADFERLARKF